MSEQRLTYGLSQVAKLAESFGEVDNMNDEEAHSFLQTHIVDAFRPSDTFYALMDLRKQALTFSHGTESFFGIRELTLPYFFQQIAEPYRELFLLWAEAGYAAMVDPQNKKTIKPFKQEYRIMVPLLNREGKYYWVTQTAVPFQLDADQHIITHLNIYQVGVAYDTRVRHNLKGEILENNLPRQDFMVKMEAHIQSYLLDAFGKKKLRMLQLYADGHSIPEVASILSISPQTVYTHNKDILQKVNGIFYERFSNVKIAATSIRAMGYLN